MRKRFAVLLGVFLLGLMSAPSATKAQETLRLPFAYIFSGPGLDFGERIWNEGLLPSVAAVNKRGGVRDKQVELYKVDTRFPDTVAWLAEFRRLCDNPNVPIVFGVGATKSTIAIFKDTQRCGVAVFNPSSGGSWPYRTANGTKDFGCCLFRFQPAPDEVIPVLIRTVKERLNIKTASLSHTIDDEFAVNNARVTRKALQDIGIDIVDDIGFKRRETNIGPYVSSHRHARANAIFMHHPPGTAGAFLLSLRERRVRAQVVTDNAISGIDFWRQSKGKAKGSIGYALYAPDDPRPEVQGWVETWRKITGNKGAPDGFVTTYYDAFQVLAHVLNTAKSLKREDIVQSFLKIKDLQTISGTITWNNSGDVFRPEPILVQLGDKGVPRLWK